MAPAPQGVGVFLWVWMVLAVGMEKRRLPDGQPFTYV